MDRNAGNSLDYQEGMVRVKRSVTGQRSARSKSHHRNRKQRGGKKHSARRVSKGARRRGAPVRPVG